MRELLSVRFERYVDDGGIHCRSLQQTTNVLAALKNRMVGVGLHLHSDMTRIVYCKDSNRRASYDNT
ncbi:hypothetical protein [Nocardia gamkensis]|uniref:hypothetical protein n=1 Tax=Nocardia gamkensis TaxID=352869 RepID=UPI0037C7A40C